MKKVVGYSRYSSNSQKETSIEIQNQYIEKFCEDNNLELVKIFSDYAKSGSTIEGRDEFKKMQEYILSHEDVKCVVAYRVDRLARDVSDFTHFWKILRNNGKSILTYKEIHSESVNPVEIFVHTLTSAISELELNTIKERTHNGIMHKAKNTTGSLGGRPPLGYTRPDPEEPLQVDTAKAEIVKKIFDLYINKGMGYGQIAKNLNSHGYLTQENQEFGKNSIRDILCNERYTGTEVYNRSEARKLGMDGKYHYNTHRSKPDKEIIKHYGAHEAIIDQATFDKAQKILNSKSRHGGGKSTALFKGIITCGLCGKSMHLDTHTSISKRTGKKYTTRKYRCNCYNDGQQHGKIDADIAEAQCLRLLKKGLFRKRGREEMLAELAKFNKEFSTDFKKLEMHQEKAKKYQVKIDRLTKAVENCQVTAAAMSLVARMDACAEEVKQLDKVIAELKEACKFNYSNEELEYIINNFENLAQESATTYETSSFIRSYVDQVTVGEDTLDIGIRDEILATNPA